MHTRLLVSSLWLALTATAFTAAGDAAALPLVRQSAVAYLTEPTLIGSAFIVGPVLITHDNEKMSRGGPCTSVYLFDPAVGKPTELIASFDCIPRRGRIAATLTISTQPSRWGYGCVLTAYQFAGDPEIHSVPLPADAH
jgi:hypothetical protein